MSILSQPLQKPDFVHIEYFRKLYLKLFLFAIFFYLQRISELQLRWVQRRPFSFIYPKEGIIKVQLLLWFNFASAERFTRTLHALFNPKRAFEVFSLLFFMECVTLLGCKFDLNFSLFFLVLY